MTRHGLPTPGVGPWTPKVAAEMRPRHAAVHRPLSDVHTGLSQTRLSPALLGVTGVRLNARQAPQTGEPCRESTRQGPSQSGAQHSHKPATLGLNITRYNPRMMRAES